MYKGTEKDVKKYFHTTFTQLNSLAKNGFNYQTKDGIITNVPVTIYLVPDMSALWKLFGEQFNCSFCDATNDNRHKWLPSDNHTFSLSRKFLQDYPELAKNVVLDALHTKLRFVGNLLGLILKKVRKDGIKRLELFFQTLPSISQFQFREKATTNNKLQEDITVDLPYLNDEQADTILLNFEQMAKCLGPKVFTSNDIMIWKLTRCIIYCFVQAPNNTLALYNIGDNLRRLLNTLGYLLRKAYPQEKFGFLYTW